VRSFPIYFDVVAVKNSAYLLKIQFEYTSPKFKEDYNRQLTAARGVDINRKSSEYEIDIVRRIVTLKKEGSWNFIATPMFKVTNTPKFINQTGECFIQTLIENTSEQTVYLSRVVFNPENVEHKVEALHQAQGADLFDQAATFKRGDRRRYLFKLVGVSGNSRLALTDG